MGLAYANRGDTVVAMVSEVEVDRATGRIWPRRFWVAHDCGLIVNPQGLKLCIEGNVVHGTSRALFEEVRFDAKNVTSLDWTSYPILEMADAPEAVEIVLINRPELPPAGAGEPSTRPVAAAIANAVFDATGVRLRRAPFARDRLEGGAVGGLASGRRNGERQLVDIAGRHHGLGPVGRRHAAFGRVQRAEHQVPQRDLAGEILVDRLGGAAVVPVVEFRRGGPAGQARPASA